MVPLLRGIAPDENLEMWVFGSPKVNGLGMLGWDFGGGFGG